MQRSRRARSIQNRPGWNLARSGFAKDRRDALLPNPAQEWMAKGISPASEGGGRGGSYAYHFELLACDLAASASSLEPGQALVLTIVRR